MKHSEKIKKSVMAFVLAASMIVSMFNFGNVTGRNEPKMEGREEEREEDKYLCCEKTVLPLNLPLPCFS